MTSKKIISNKMINKIEVTNFKCFESLELEFSYLNLLSGINSMGKSTIIQALLLLRQSYEQNAMHKGIYLNGKYTNIGIGRDLLYMDAKKDIIGISISWRDYILHNNYRYHKNADFLQRLEEIKELDDDMFLDMFLTHANLFDNGFSYIAADRLGPQDTYSKSYYEVRDRQQLGNHGEYAVHYLKEHELDDVLNEAVLYGSEEKEHPKLISQVEYWMGEITPGIKLRIEDYGHSNLLWLAVNQRSTMASDYFSVQNVGFGISYVLPVVLSLIKARPGDLVILENPEAHLHPRGQRKIGELIARAAQGGVQIVLETHSDHILNGIRISAKEHRLSPSKVRLYYFDRTEEIEEGGRKKSFPLIHQPILQEDGRLSFWPEGFFDEWDNAIDEMF